jgi:hypothetical protein
MVNESCMLQFTSAMLVKFRWERREAIKASLEVPGEDVLARCVLDHTLYQSMSDSHHDRVLAPAALA